MAMISCPECGKQVSDKAPACVNCGVPIGQSPQQYNQPVQQPIQQAPPQPQYVPPQQPIKVHTHVQHGCIGCKICEGGSAKIGRTVLLWTLMIFTGFMAAFAIPFSKKCVFCGHTMFLNKHVPGGS